MNRPNRRIPAWLAVGALIALCTPAAAVPIVTAEGLGVPEILDTGTMIDVNNIAMFVTNSGGFARDLQSPGGPAGTFFPKGTDKTPIYAAGLWFGSKVNGDVRVTVAEYGLEYSPGRTHYDSQQGRQVWEDPALASLKTYKINKGDVTSSDYLNWPPDAPRDAEGNPLNAGDQTLWAVYNDSDPVPHTNNAGGSSPQNLEVQQTTFAFNRQGPLGNMIFVKFKFYNKGNETLTDCYASLWSDPDLGGAGDDVVGCDTLLSVGYVYNATNNDEMYGARPPCVGYDFFQGPMVPGAPSDTAHAFGQAFPGYKNLPMTSFNKYINGTDPDSKLASYNYMQGLTKEGDPLIDEVTGRVTRYFDAGDPVKGTGWLDQDPADKRLMLSSGPFTMAPGDSQEVVVAIIIAQATDRLSSVTLMKLYDQRAQAVFDAAFELIPPPPQPTVYVREQDRAIDLIWTTDADGWTSVNPGKWDAKFEGFNIYQGTSAAGPWTKIASWDVADTLGNLYRDTFDTDGNIVRELYQTGTNSDVVHHFLIDRDYVGGGSLINYRDYYYALTSYGVDLQGIQQYYVQGNLVGYVMRDEDTETGKQTITATPSGSSATIDQTAQHAGVSDGSVAVYYVKQDEITGDTYEVTFRDNPDSTDNAVIPYVWDLTDRTTGSVVLSGQKSQVAGIDEPYTITDGFILDVVGPPLAMKSAVWSGGTRWLSYIDWGGSAFSGAVGLASEWGWGSTLVPADYSKTVEIRFTADSTAAGAWSDCATFRRDQGYASNGIGKFPGSVWDVTNPSAPRRLNVCFIEDSRFGNADSRWDPTDSADDGGREYLFIMNSDYDGGAAYSAITAFRDQPLDLLMVGWLRLRPGHPYLEADATFTWTANYINTPGDTFTFKTSRVGTGAGSVVQNDLNAIRAVPNPYLNQSDYELNQFNRIIRFTNLPSAECTIRIFNLAGELIRSIVKPQSTAGNTSSYAVWDLQNSKAIPVASGIYIYSVEAKGIGSKVGKLAVFVEKERLNRF